MLGISRRNKMRNADTHSQVVGLNKWIKKILERRPREDKRNKGKSLTRRTDRRIAKKAIG